MLRLRPLGHRCYNDTPCGARTRGPKIKSLMLCQTELRELMPEGIELGISVFPECQSVFPVCQSSFRIVIKIQFFPGPTETLFELESSKVPPENHILSS